MNKSRHILLVMPTLVIARHAHATQTPMADHERYLTKDGHAEALRAAQYLHRLPLSFVVSSSATRTQQTAAPLLELLREDHRHPEFHIDGALYDSDGSAWLEILGLIPAQTEAAYVVGHNPTAWAVAEYVAGEKIETFRPSSVAICTLKDWKITRGCAAEIEVRDFVS